MQDAMREKEFPIRTILAVDDNAQNLLLLVHLFRQLPVKLDTLTDGRKAALACQKRKYDLLLLDDMMPAMDGPTLLKHIREDEKGQNGDTPAVVLTANDVKAFEGIYRQAGFDGYAQKPLRMEGLERVLRLCFGDGQLLDAEIKKIPNEVKVNWMESLDGEGISTTDGLRYSDGDEAFYRELLLLFADRAVMAGKKKENRGFF